MQVHIRRVTARGTIRIWGQEYAVVGRAGRNLLAGDEVRVDQYYAGDSAFPVHDVLCATIGIAKMFSNHCVCGVFFYGYSENDAEQKARIHYANCAQYAEFLADTASEVAQ